MGLTSSKNQSLVLPVNLPRAPPLTPKETEESAVSVCHHMTTLLASSDREVKQTALQVLAQMTNAAATSHLLDGATSYHLLNGATSHHLQDGATTHLQDRTTSHHLLNGATSNLLDGVTSHHLQDRATTYLQDRRSPSFQSTDIRYGSNAGGGHSIGQTLDSRNNNWIVPVKSGRSSWDQQTNGVMEASGSGNGKSARVMMKQMDNNNPMASVEVKSAAAAGATTPESLIRGQKLAETHGAKTELWMPDEETFLSKAHLATIICGMLNSPSGGTIYIGVHEYGTIWGLHLDRSGRDLLRRNLAKVIKDNISPTVLCPSKVTIHFVSVDCGEGNIATVVVVNIAAFPACGIVWETPRIYQARCLSVVELEGRYIRTEGVSSTFNLKMKPMDLLKEQKKILNTYVTASVVKTG